MPVPAAPNRGALCILPTLPNPGPSMEARHPLQKPVARWECGWNSGGSCGPAYLNHVIHDVHIKAFTVTTGAPDPPQVLKGRYSLH